MFNLQPWQWQEIEASVAAKQGLPTGQKKLDEVYVRLREFISELGQ